MQNSLVEQTELLNPWIQKLWTTSHERISGVLDELWREKLKGVGLTFPTAILFLREPERYAVWMKPLARGLAMLLPNFESRTRSGKNYASYCAAVRGLCEQTGCEPRIVDLVLFKVSQGGKRKKQWDVFIEWARKFYEYGRFEELERHYKLEVAEQLTQVAAAIRQGNEDWLPQLKKCFTYKKNNITAWQASDGFVKWCQTHPTVARDAIRDLWDAEASPPASIQTFCQLLETDDKSLKGVGARTSIAAFLQMQVDPLNSIRPTGQNRSGLATSLQGSQGSRMMQTRARFTGRCSISWTRSFRRLRNADLSCAIG